MTKNIIIGLLVLLVLGEGYFLYKARKDRAQLAAMVSKNSEVRPSGAPQNRPPLVGKGAKLAGSPLEHFAYKIAPGEIPAESKAKLTGYSVKPEAEKDGSLLVTLSPKDSDSQFQQYVVKSGETLWFIEMTTNDDKADSDKDLNYRDDYGLITDANGVIQ